MSDRDYLPIFPSWRLFFLFSIICYMELYVVGLTPVTFIGYIDPIYIGFSPMVLGLALSTLLYFMFMGSNIAKRIIILFNMLIIFLIAGWIFIYGDADMLWARVSVILISLIACILMISKHFNSFVMYRKRHLSVIKKAKNGEPLDDGTLYLQGKHGIAFTKLK